MGEPENASLAMSLHICCMRQIAVRNRFRVLGCEKSRHKIDVQICRARPISLASRYDRRRQDVVDERSYCLEKTEISAGISHEAPIEARSHKPGNANNVFFLLFFSDVKLKRFLYVKMDLDGIQ